MSKAPKTKTGKKKSSAKNKAMPPVETAAAESSPASESSAAPTAAKSSGGGSGLFALVVFLAVLAGGGYVTWPYWGHMIMGQPQGDRLAVAQKPPTDDATDATTDDPTLRQLKAERRQMRDQLDRLLERMSVIENAVDTVKKVIHATARLDQNTGQNKDRDESLLVLSQRLEELEKSGQDVKSLLRRMDQMEKEAATQTAAPIVAQAAFDATAKALVLAVSNLRQAISLGAPFTGALDALKAIAGGDPDIDAGVALLAKIAATGTPTLAVLKDRFGGLAGRIVQVSRTQQESGWMDRAVGRLSSLVTWRRVDGKGAAPEEANGQDTSVDAMVAAAENRLKAGDLRGAVKALDGLSINKKAAQQAAPWLAAAKGRILAERAVATLHVHAVSLLTPAKK